MYSGFGSEFPHTDQLIKLGTVCIPNYDWKENHPLGKAEWIKFFGYLTGKQKIAESYFNNVVKEYKHLSKIALKAKTKPTVFSGNITGEIWYTPAGESFFAKLFKDANCNYVYADTKGIGSIELSFERILLDNKNTDFWFNPGFSPLDAIVEANPKMSYFKSVQNKNVFCYSPHMDFFWELGAVEPHHVLEDLIKIMHPELVKDKQLHFYKNIGQ
jgi:iron complex transport system substrate-binding protein